MFSKLTSKGHKALWISTLLLRLNFGVQFWHCTCVLVLGTDFEA